jgi:DNA-directed RNA polymerase specialized sigma24 family protein
MDTNPIAPLTPRIRGAAHNVARRYGADPDDVEQDLALAILEAYAADPDFLAQAPEAVVNYAANRAGWQHRKAALHAARTGLEDRPIGHDPAAPTLIEAFAGTDPWPGVERCLDVEEALANLDARDRRIAAGLAQGFSAREIAPLVGCSFRTVYNRMGGPIAAALAA